MQNKRAIVLITIALLIVGAIIFRRWHSIALWFYCVLIALYILSDIPATVRRVIRFGHATPLERFKLVSSVALLTTFVSTVVSGSPNYFLLLVNLVFELFYYERR
ncbi:MAG: hypothetical protein LBH06_03050 [Rikenellaceae bacterium]|jgi:hypothetical protein|nr:hypothetical protein [Rikenellaceae bacterium]